MSLMVHLLFCLALVGGLSCLVGGGWFFVAWCVMESREDRRYRAAVHRANVRYLECASRVSPTAYATAWRDLRMMAGSHPKEDR